MGRPFQPAPRAQLTQLEPGRIGSQFEQPQPEADFGVCGPLLQVPA
jgi:hypothetical protein